MFWNEDADAVSVKPTKKPAVTTQRQYFQDGNPQAGKRATVLNPDWLNTIVDEFCNLVETAGLKPNKMDDTQLAQALSILVKDGFDNAGFIPSARKITTNSPLKGGGVLTRDLVLEVNDATESGKGVVQLATSAEAAAGTNKTKAVTPSGLSAVVAPFILLGEIRLLPYRITELPKGWYFCNGERYGSATAQAKALAALSASFRTDWGITTTSAGTNVPNLLNGSNGYFVRGVNGAARLPGSIQQDAMRAVAVSAKSGGHVVATGTFQTGWVEGDGAPSVSGVFSFTSNGSYKRISGSSGDANYYKNIAMNISAAVPPPTISTTQAGTVADENRPMNIGMTTAIYLGV